MCGEKKGTAHQNQNLIAAVKYGGGSIMVWSCFAASGPGQLAIINGKMNLSLSRHFAGKCKAICPPIEAQQKLGDATGHPLKHRSKSTTEWLQQKKILLLVWPSQS